MLLHDLSGKAIALDQESVRDVKAEGQHARVLLSDGQAISVCEHFDLVAALVSGDGRTRP